MNTWTDTFWTFQMDSSVIETATKLKTRTRATGNPRTTRRALPLEIQQTLSAYKDKERLHYYPVLDVTTKFKVKYGACVNLRR